jgi:site-specific DNA recombinase
MITKNTALNVSLLNKFARGTVKVVNNDEVLNCVIYTRVSSKEQMDNNGSLDSQRKYCTEYTLKNRLDVKGFFGGTYESAKSDERKEFNRMLKFVKGSKAKISYLIVHSTFGLTRNEVNIIYFKKELEKVGVAIILATTNKPHYDKSSHLGESIRFLFNKYSNNLKIQG